MPRKYKSMAERLLANSVESTTCFWDGVPCRDWTGSVTPQYPGAPREQSYGKMGVRFKSGPRKGKSRTVGAHRVSAKVFKPWLKIGTKNIVRHLCNRPICIEPHHLTGSEQRVNIRQCVKEGRHKTPFRRSMGERHAAEFAT